MRVDRGDDVIDARLEAHRERRLRDELAGLRSDDVRAEDPPVRAGRDELHQAVALAEGERPARGLEREARRLRVGVPLLRLRFGEPDRRHLRVGVDDVRDHLVVHLRVLAEDHVDRDLALGRSDVGELRRADLADAVADRPDAAHVRAHPVIHDEAEALALQPRALDAAVVRDAAGAEEDLIALDGLGLPIDLVGDGDGLPLARDLGDGHVVADGWVEGVRGQLHREPHRGCGDSLGLPLVSMEGPATHAES